MLPETTPLFDELSDDDLELSIDEDEILPTKTYKIDFESGHILGMIEEEESVLQFIKKVLSTEKYSDVIYDWYYGNELQSLVGASIDYAIADIPRIIEEALSTDDRIQAVDDFEFEQISPNTLSVAFTVTSIYSTIEYEMEVGI